MRLNALFGLSFTVLALISAGCAAQRNQTTSTGDAGSAGQGAAGGGGSAGSGNNGGGGTNVGGAGPGGSAGTAGSGPACAKFTAEAQQAPAAMLVALDASSSMKNNQKWGAAQVAIKTAIDADAFDTMSIGLVTFPTGTVKGPACLFGFNVWCGVSALPQVAIAPAGKDKSNAGSGVRHDIYQYLVSHSPTPSDDDGSPVYDALAGAYAALASENIERRILILISDGGFSCTSLSTPQRQAYTDANGCLDWEYPDTVNKLITSARTDPQKPIFTFIVGVPGSDTVGADPNSEPPYHMKLALSTYAVSGSPDTVDPACSKDAVFTQNGADPAIPCHIDLSGGAAFKADTLANAIQTIRGKALGCVYDLPKPPPGETIDKDYVNVGVTVDGTMESLKKRSDPNDTCAADGCWDYNVGGQVQLLGKACDDLSKAMAGKVDIQVGCQTIVK